MEIAIQVLLCALGFSAHILKSMKQAASTWDMSVVQYLRNYPKQTALALIGVAGSLAIAHESGQLNLTTAFAIGYMANSVADVLTGRVIKQMR